MEATTPMMFLLLLAIFCTSCTAWPRLRESPTSCERLQDAAMNVYDQVQNINSMMGPHGGMPLPPREMVAEVVCRIADVSTLDELTTAIDTAIDPDDLSYQVRDIIQLGYLFGTSVLEFLGGVDGVRVRIEFVQVWVEFAMEKKLGQQQVSYDDAYMFTSILISQWGDDFLETFFKGLSAASGMMYYGMHGGPRFNPDDIIDAEKLAQALSGPLDPQTFSETSGLSRETAEMIIAMAEFASSPMTSMMYPMVSSVVEPGLVLLETADDLGLLDLTV